MTNTSSAFRKFLLHSGLVLIASSAACSGRLSTSGSAKFAVSGQADAKDTGSGLGSGDTSSHTGGNSASPTMGNDQKFPSEGGSPTDGSVAQATMPDAQATMPDAQAATGPLPPISSTGWTVLDKSPDSHMIYVSSSDGNDSRDGSSESAAVATLARGYALLRNGYPDWLLLKSGDTWTKPFPSKWEKSGRSPTEKMVVSSYGTGATPLIRAPLDGNHAVLWIVDATSHLAVVGLAIRPAGRIPGEPDFDPSVVSKDPLFGISIYNGPSDILIEGCEIAYYAANIQVQGSPTKPSDIQVRRNVILDSYADSSFGHSQGMYLAVTTRTLIEENIFDHNGWNEMATNAEPTIFNHNVYMSETNESPTLRGNLSTRAGSMCFKLKAEDNAAENTGLLAENNVCLQDAIGVSLGGNPPAGGLMYKNATIRRNVFSNLSPRPGGPTTSCLGVDLSSCDGASVTGNFLLDTNCSGAVGITIQSFPNKGIVVTDNVFNHWSSSTVKNVASDPSGVMVTNSWVERPASEYVDGARSVTTYATSQGFADIDALIAAARTQTKARWHVELTGTAITDYIAEGFSRK